jgi:hypothetical protein
MDKREARKEFKSKKTPKGIFAIRCAATRKIWVSASDHLDSAQNGVWFQLRNGIHHNKRLQSEWNANGEQAFAYEALETLDDDVSPLLLEEVLLERQKQWEKELGASIA